MLSIGVSLFGSSTLGSATNTILLQAGVLDSRFVFTRSQTSGVLAVGESLIEPSSFLEDGAINGGMFTRAQTAGISATGEALP
jgi:hypothetical protein